MGQESVLDAVAENSLSEVNKMKMKRESKWQMSPKPGE